MPIPIEPFFLGLNFAAAMKQLLSSDKVIIAKLDKLLKGDLRAAQHVLINIENIPEVQLQVEPRRCRWPTQ